MAQDKPRGDRMRAHFLLRTTRGELEHDRYALVCVLILLTILSMAVLGDGAWGLVTLVLMTVTLNVTLGTSGAGRRARIVGAVVSGLTTLAVAATILLHTDEPARFAYLLGMLALSVVTPLVIARRLLSHPVVNLGTVTGAAAIYLLIGLVFSVVYALVGSFIALRTGQGGALAFFTASRPLGPSDFTYYSFVTMTTVGYGDITAASPLGRMLSITEALIGQLYLVTVIAVLVTNMGRSRRPIADDSVAELAEEQ